MESLTEQACGRVQAGPYKCAGGVNAAGLRHRENRGASLGRQEAWRIVSAWLTAHWLT